MSYNNPGFEQKHRIIKKRITEMKKEIANGGEQVTLKRQLNPMHVWAIAFGCIIGWGSFINPGKKFLPNSGVAGTAIAMVLGALVMVIIAASYAYMVPKYPQSGGEFTFTKNCFGKIPAFICGWFLVAGYLTNVPMNSTAIGMIVDGVDGDANILKWGFSYEIAGFPVHLGEILFAGAILILFGILNIVGVKKAGFVQIVLASLLAICAFTLCIACIISADKQGINWELAWGFDKNAALEAAGGKELTNIAGVNFADYANGTTSQGKIAAILATFAIAPWAFVGFDTIPQAAEEFKFSYKKVMKILVIAIAFGAFVYISNNTVAAAVYANWPEDVLKNDWVLLIAAKHLLGNFGTVLIAIGVSCAVLSGIMGFYLASSRLMFAMARDGYLPKVFSKVDPKYGTPKNAMIFCIAVSLAGPILGRNALGWFVDMSAIGASIGYMFTCLATLITMKKFGDGKIGLKILAAAGAFLSIVFIVLQLIPIPGLSGVSFGTESYILLIVWIVLGALFYIYENAKKKKNELE